jgi:hypothetical protein
MIWMYDKKTRNLKRVSIKQVAQESGFYSDSDETKLANHVEGPANVVLDKLRQRQAITTQERAELAYYIAAMIRRVPRYRRRAQEMIPEVLEKVIARTKAALIEVANVQQVEPTDLEKSLELVDKVGEKFKEETPPEMMEIIRTPFPNDEWVKAIYFMTWRVCTTKWPNCFLTSDNPAFFFESDGLGNENVELVFPISSEVALHCSWQKGPDGREWQIHHQKVREFNRRLACYAERFIFYREGANWIESIAHRRPEDLQRMVR